jgi:hypothetical protein
VALGLLAVESCGSIPGMNHQPCSPTTCPGCCTETGVCVSGQTAITCGKGGAACVACNAAQVCTNNVCVVPPIGGGNGGGGATGGGAAGGSSDGCATITMIGGSGHDVGVFTSDTTNGFDEEDAYVTGADAGDTLWISEYYANGAIPAAPRVVQLGSTTWSNCADCVVYSVGCTQNSCVEDYLAQSGTLNVDQQTLDPDAGVFSGSVANLHLIQWDGINNMNSDGPTAGGKCLDITMGSFDGTWP